MYYELYIDVLFLENFMMDSLIMLSVRKIQKLPVSCLRLFAGTMLASVFTCVIVILDLPVILKNIILYVFVPIFMVTFGLKLKNRMLILRSIVLLYITAFLYGGILYALRTYIRHASLFYGAQAATYCFVNGFWSILDNMRKEQRNVYRVSIFTSKGTFELLALEDTGNRLTDPVSGDPVCIIDKNTAEQIFMYGKEQNDRQEIKQEEKIRYIMYRTIAGESLMPIVRIEKMIVYSKQKQEIRKPLIGICKEPISERQLYHVILNSDILGGAGNVSKSSGTTAV